jgi:hypothetical protein
MFEAIWQQVSIGPAPRVEKQLLCLSCVVAYNKLPSRVHRPHSHWYCMHRDAYEVSTNIDRCCLPGFI